LQVNLVKAIAQAALVGETTPLHEGDHAAVVGVGEEDHMLEIVGQCYLDQQVEELSP
jgi:hypothetical protein